MSLTISQPAKVEFGGRTIHDFSPRIALAKSRLSPTPNPRIDSPLSSLRVGVSVENKMTTPHRGLPPPSAMTLPDPGRPPPSFGQSLGAIPNPPNSWPGQEDSMRSWLAAKSEEDKRKQEEEKTRQEQYKLEQRRIEQSMLREALQAGIPPNMVPMIYAGIGGSQLANLSLEWLQQYAAQLQATQQQMQQRSPDELHRRDGRLIGQSPSHYGVAQPHQQVVPSQPVEHAQQPGALQTTFPVSAYHSSRQPPTSTPRSATRTQLPRLTTNEMYVHQPVREGPSSAHPLHQTHTLHQQQDQPASSPSIYFHHWVPPSEYSNSKSNAPQTPAGKNDPHSAHPSTHLSESDYKESPRKRKAQGPHQPAPPPTSAGPAYTSPSFSTTSSTSASGGRKFAHARSRSNTDSRPQTRGEGIEPPRFAQTESTCSVPEEAGARKPSLPIENSAGSEALRAESRVQA